MGDYMRVTEAARHLGVCRATVKQAIYDGRLRSVRSSSAFASPHLIPTAQVVTLLRNQREMDDLSGILDKKDAWEQQVRFLNTRAINLAKVIGPEPIREMLRRHGLKCMGDLTPETIRSVHAGLLVLSRGKKPAVPPHLAVENKHGKRSMHKRPQRVHSDGTPVD